MRVCEKCGAKPSDGFVVDCISLLNMYRAWLCMSCLRKYERWIIKHPCRLDLLFHDRIYVMKIGEEIYSTKDRCENKASAEMDMYDAIVEWMSNVDGGATLVSESSSA